MAYAPRPDGLFDVILDDGMRLPSALSEQQLQQLGHQPLAPTPPQPMPGAPQPTAFLSGDTPMLDAGGGGASSRGPEPARLDAPQQVPGAGGTSGAQPSGGGGTLGAAPMPANEGGGGAPSFLPEPAPDPIAPKEAPRAKPENLVRVGGMPSAGPGGGGTQQRIVKIPGGDQRASFTRVPGQPVSEEVRRDLLDDTRPEDLTISADSIATQRAELQQQREKALLDQQQALDQQKARRSQVDQMIQQKFDLIAKRDEDAEKLRPQTAQEIWDNKSTFARIAAAISIGLGGYNAGAGYTRENEALKFINEGIRQDIDDQRARYEYARKRRDEAVNDYSRALQVYGTPEAADLDMQMRRLALVEKQIQARGEAIGTQEYLNAANAMATELRQQRAQTRQRLNELEQGKILQENWLSVPDRYVGTGGPAKPKKPENIVRLPSGEYMYARDSTSARAAQQKVIANARMAQLADRMRQLTDTVGKRTPTAEERAQAETIKGEMTFTYKDAVQAGALDKGLQDAMGGYLGRAEDVFQIKDNAAKLREVKRIADKKVQEVVEFELHPTEDYGPSIAPRPAGQASDE